MPKMQTLTCRAGHTWERPAQRGKPPHYCPDHKAGAKTRLYPAPGDMPESSTLTAPGPKSESVIVTGTGKNSIRPRERVHVSEVKVGDWTHITGFRPVTAVKTFPRKKEIRLTWSDGTSHTYSFMHKDKDTHEAVPRYLLVARAADMA